MEKRGTSRTSRPTVHGRFAALDHTMGAQRSSVPTINRQAIKQPVHWVVSEAEKEGPPRPANQPSANQEFSR